jgi:hypothetical protein
MRHSEHGVAKRRQVFDSDAVVGREDDILYHGAQFEPIEQSGLERVTKHRAHVVHAGYEWVRNGLAPPASREAQTLMGKERERRASIREFTHHGIEIRLGDSD